MTEMVKKSFNIKSNLEDASAEKDTKVNYRLSQYKPVGDRILLRRDDSDYKTKGGIILPHTVRTPKYEGILIGLGNGELIKELGLEKGMRVLVGKYSGMELVIENREYILCDAEDVMMIIKEKNNGKNKLANKTNKAKI